MLFIRILRDDCNSVHVRITFLFRIIHTKYKFNCYYLVSLILTYHSCYLLLTAPYTNVIEAYEEIKQTLEAGPQNYGATVTVELDSIVQGFEAEPLPVWFRTIVDTAATQIYNQGDNKSFVDSGVGGTIGFLAVIQESLKGMTCYTTVHIRVF